MTWELRLRGSCPDDAGPAEAAAVRQEMERFVQRLRERGHRLEVVMTTPDGQLDVFEVRPEPGEGPAARPRATRDETPARMR